MAVTRDAILAVLRAALEPLPHVVALYEGGAAAWGRLDRWSDVDLYIVAEEGAASETFRTVEGALRTLSPIERTFVARWPKESGIEQAFYRLEGAGPFLLVDLAVLTPAAPDKFLEPEIHGPNVVYFDKTGVTKAPPLDRAAFDAKMRERLARLREHVEMFHAFVEKEMNRGHWIEAIDDYRAYVVGPLMEALRMEHRPLHHAFRTRYVHDEWPPEVVARVQELLFVRDPDDLRRKYADALRWFRETATRLA